MSKREFLKDLERRLSVLDEQEVRDIVNEYEGIIDEKIKDGKSETAAVNEFGNIEELASEILKTYKINPKYCSGNSDNKDKTKEAMKSFEEWVKQASGEMAKFLKNASDGLGKSGGKTPSVELVLEIVIKIVILLVILAILKIPFSLIGGLGIGLFSFSFTPADWIFAVIWKILSGVVYLAAAIFIFWAMFREYFTGFTPTDKYSNNNAGYESKAKVVHEHKTATPEESAQKESIKSENSNGIAVALLTVIRVFVVIAFLLPLWLTQAGLVVAMLISFYYFIQGVNILGLVIILVGVIIGMGGLSDLVYKIAFKIKKVSLLCITPFIISMVFVTAGAFIFANNILDFEYVDSLPENVEYSTIQKTFNLEYEKRIIPPGFASVKYEIDENLINDEIVVQISYIDKINEIRDIKMADERNYYYLRFTQKHFSGRLYELRDLYYSFIKDLKDNKVYNYSKLNKPNVVIKANAHTMAIIREEK
jgi:uncharacterized membrane protein